ncbi:pyridoxal phosphate-dependent aminotransferase [Oceanobacter mangrovi]|uniref:pyridoxal phosphate-dependent aminotransferase n=1 Tax=Oceanobacter mangrovi TaxID=2862510 RepID=UPI001C8DADE5|nr:pyridoxal phosphate-dependent aminotransferase [Oceanobacter mangrovi]
MQEIRKSDKLANVFYDIRGPVLEAAKRMEEEGHRILKLNIGNPKPFGLDAPEEIIQDVIYNLPDSEGYSDSKGLFSARKAIMQYAQQKKIQNVAIEDIIIGNGVSELIVASMQGLINNGDEVLIPAPDYPLWTGAVTLAGGRAVHYICDEQSDWYPDLDDMRAKVTDRTKAMVLINPNNPTGAVYPKELLLGMLEIARENNLVVFSDEIYDKILFDGVEHVSTASLADDLLIITMNGLSKNYRLAGFRSGWMIISGAKHRARDYIQGLEMLSSMRLCANVPAMFAIQTALGGYQSIDDLVAEGGRIRQQRDIAYEALNSIPGISCVKPKGALYCFPRMDVQKFNIRNDERMVLDLLEQQKILIVHGAAFNWSTPDHFRVVFLPRPEDLNLAMDRVGQFFASYTQI